MIRRPVSGKATMKISRSMAGLAVAAALAVFSVGCGSGGGAPGTGASTTAAPSAPATNSPSSPAPVTLPPATTTPSGQARVPRCHTSQLTASYAGLNAAMGGQRGMTLILTNHSGSTCYVHGYPGLAFYNSGGFPMATHLTWMKAPHSTVILHPGGNAQAMLTWRVSTGTATPFNPGIVHVTPPDEYAYLWSVWQGGPVLGGNITAWPLRAVRAGPFAAGTGTIASPFTGM